MRTASRLQLRLDPEDDALRFGTLVIDGWTTQAVAREVDARLLVAFTHRRLPRVLPRHRFATEVAPDKLAGSITLPAQREAMLAEWDDAGGCKFWRQGINNLAVTGGT